MPQGTVKEFDSRNHNGILLLDDRTEVYFDQASLEGLRSAHGFLQRRVASELTLKHTPTLDFVYDDSIERGMRLSELIDREAGR